MSQSTVGNDAQIVLNTAISHVNKTSLLDLCLQAELLVQVVMLLLLLASIWGWTIIFSKMMMLSIYKANTCRWWNRFLEISNESLSEIHLREIKLKI